ncbi:winged helix-turn-helix domain-containing protein [Streptomyces sp. J2-1]|uniref:AfsR/SARP family transcriptional regulator n=1 Tax=Streptomyces corallincola TaxID=2851888 RepID=UPI001C38AF74|nr:BTAD domain-containing putative transcriptional regulator [Streptomyces corallincola]MBV2353936.1 winged helix-turn-helix domain-containing protein [Streptomyces corallincola]
MDILFTLLGPVRAWRGETELELGPPKQRSLLALLLAHAGNPVTTSEIVDVLWGEDPPDTAVNVIQRHVGALRRLLEPALPTGGASRWLVRGSGGYRLHAEADTLDLLRFRNLRQRAATAAAAGRADEATTELLRALALWRGPVAAGIPAEARSHPIFTAVDNEYPAAVKDLAEHALRAGPEAVAQALPAVGSAAARHTLDEALQAKLMALLVARGLRAEAQDVYETVRRSLDGSLGVEPGPELRAAHGLALAPAPAAPTGIPVPRPRAGAPAPLTPGPADAPEQPAACTRPAQLPMSSTAFTGRARELALMDALLPPQDPAAPIPSTVVGTITGTAGVGKTALAVHWAHRVADRFPDGQLHIDLRGFHPGDEPLGVAEAVGSFLDALGVPRDAVPAALDAQILLYRSLVADRRFLILLDNARDSEHVLPLLPGTSRSLVLVTSRSRLTGLIASVGARCVTLGVLDEEEAREVLRRRLGSHRVDHEPDAAAEIATRCARLPLALAVVTARAAMNPSFPLTAIAAELRDEARTLDAFTAEVPLADVRSALSWSYNALSPGAAAVFRVLARHDGPYCTPADITALTGLPAARVRPLLAELSHHHLAEETSPGRFTQHALLRVYGTELADEENDVAPASLPLTRPRHMVPRQGTRPHLTLVGVPPAASSR